MRSAVFTLIAMLVAAPALAQNFAPSFDCAKAGNATERAICDAPILGQLDQELAKVYRIARSSGDTVGLRDQQRRWLSKRNACGGSVECLRAEYIARINTLFPPHDTDAIWRTVLAGPFGENEITLFRSNGGALSLYLTGGGEFYSCDFGPAPVVGNGPSLSASSDGDTLTLERIGTSFLMPETDANMAVFDNWCGMRAPFFPGLMFKAG